MAQYYILDTLEEFNSCNDACYAAHMAVYDDNNGYRNETLCWAKPRQRITDGKYICLICPSYDNSAGYTIEESSDDWFPPSDP